MKRQIRQVSAVQTAKVMALMYFVIGLIFFLIMGIFSAFMPGPRPPFATGFMLAMPFFYLIFGFVFTVISALVYNLVAKWTGGVEFTVEDVD